MESRLEKLVESANNHAIGCPVDAGECEILFDNGWTHAIEVVSRDFFLVEIKNTGWFAVADREQAMAFSEEE